MAPRPQKANIQFPNLPLPSPNGADILERERAKATFDVDELAQYIHGQEYLKKQDELLKVLQKEPLFDKSNVYYQGRDEKFRASMAKAKRMIQLAKIHKWSNDDLTTAVYLLDESGPFHLHQSMYLTSLQTQTTDEQKKKFLAPAEAYEHIGCYAQTELGHGSNVQGLETTATYDKGTQEFVIHSPVLTASKWWIGSLGRTANHACVMAQLIIDGKSYGPHAFVVPIRDLKTHKSLPGVTVGDVGPKFGLNTLDNGFVLFDKVRIPHDHMLARYSHVVKETGVYERPPNAKVGYGTMTWVRASIVMHARLVLARAATVAIRYLAIRRQFGDKDAPIYVHGQILETQTLDYTMVQYRLLPLIAQSLALHFTGNEMKRLYSENQKQMAGGNFSLLADLHASSSGLKSLTSMMAADGIELARRACGGHGFSMFSGLVHFYQDYLPTVTWEGDNYMLTQQVARYLLKAARELKEKGGHVPTSSSNPTIEYLRAYMRDPHAQCTIRRIGDLQDNGVILACYGHRAAYMVMRALHLRDVEHSSWNSLLVEFYRMSIAHCQFILVKNFLAAIETDSNLNEQHAIKHVLEQLFRLFALHTISQEGAEFLASGYLSARQYEIVKEEVMTLLREVRPNAVALVDAFKFPDYLLNSSLGRYDGNVYKDMTERAAREPINALTMNVNIDSPEIVRGEEPNQLLKEAITKSTGKAKL